MTTTAKVWNGTAWVTANQRVRVAGAWSALPAVDIIDSFNRSDSSSTMGSTDTGQVWTTHIGTAGISSNRAYAPVVVSSEAIATIETGWADLDLSIIVQRGSAMDSGPIFRAIDNNTYLFARVNASTSQVQLYRRVSGGSLGLLASGALSPVPVDSTMRVVAVGDSIEVFVDGVSRLTHTLSAANMTTFGSLTRAGMRFRSTNNTFDDLHITPA